MIRLAKLSAVRLASLAFAATSSVLLLASAGSVQAAQGPAYAATPEKAPTAASFIVRERLWKCDGAGTCWGPASTGNRNTACALAAQRLGKLNSFAVNGQAFDAAALERCNKRA